MMGDMMQGSQWYGITSEGFRSGAEFGKQQLKKGLAVHQINEQGLAQALGIERVEGETMEQFLGRRGQIAKQVLGRPEFTELVARGEEMAGAHFVLTEGEHPEFTKTGPKVREVRAVAGPAGITSGDIGLQE
jgi:hypothetical protein